MILIRRRLLAEQIVAVVVLGCGTKVDAMWYVPQYVPNFPMPVKHKSDGNTPNNSIT